jgi:hypothetical protein
MEDPDKVTYIILDVPGPVFCLKKKGNLTQAKKLDDFLNEDCICKKLNPAESPYTVHKPFWQKNNQFITQHKKHSQKPSSLQK